MVGDKHTQEYPTIVKDVDFHEAGVLEGEEGRDRVMPHGSQFRFGSGTADELIARALI